MKNTRERVKNIRRDFEGKSLNEKDTPEDPLHLFRIWVDEAFVAELKDPNAFVLSTYANEEVDSRVVLMRDIYEEGIQFFTNYRSKKGREINEHAQAAVNFFWADLNRQLRLKVKVKRLDEKESDLYFHSRPRESQIGAWASRQSQELESREELEKRVAYYRREFEGKEVSRPEFWGGYLAEPYYYEFWQGRMSRLHDRITYELEKGQWQKRRLFP